MCYHLQQFVERAGKCFKSRINTLSRLLQVHPSHEQAPLNVALSVASSFDTLAQKSISLTGKVPNEEGEKVVAIVAQIRGTVWPCPILYPYGREKKMAPG